ncbi:hypothetical protein ABZ807_31410 [Micromonospora sp. NPDC047548]|uniref:hypothetical protein n=1 Tax=Micromonospora sp. NPDC047548 TaxID=3155624 RepID=UPI0033E85298
MSREALRRMLADMADDITSAPPVDAVIARSIRVRRRRREILGASVAVVLISTAGVTWWHQEGRGSAPFGLTGDGARPTPVPADETFGPDAQAPKLARLDRLPARLTKQPDTRGQWPDPLDPPAGAPTVAAAPLSHAVLLTTPTTIGSGSNVVIYAYGESAANGGSGDGRFRWARLPVDLGLTRDASGNRAVPLDTNSLGPMGLRAAFPQPDFLVTVDIVTGTVKRIPVPGLNESVSWLADGVHVLVSSGTGTRLVDVVAGSVVSAAADGRTVTPLVGSGNGLTTVTMDGAPGGSPIIRSYDDGGLVERSQLNMGTGAPTHYRIADLAPRGWRMHDRIAQVASGPADGPARGTFLVVINVSTGKVVHLLDLGPGRTAGCCAVLGWANGDDVLVRTDREGLLKWHLPNGSVTLLADRPVDGIISIAPTGCDWRLTIRGVTTACTT